MSPRKSSNGPGAISPKLASRILDLAKDGHKPTAIAKELGGAVTRQAIDAFLKRKRSPGIVHRDPKPANVVDEAEAALGEADAGDASGGAVDVARRLVKVTALVDKLEPGLLTDTVSPALYEKLVKLEADLSERLEGMRPATPPDPETDVANRSAADRLVAKIERSVRVAEERAVCSNCGRRPW